MKRTHPSTRPVFLQKRLSAAALAGLLASAMVLPMTIPAHAQKVAVVNVQTVAQGYRASELRGKPVVNATGAEIGKIDDLIVDKDKVLYAILQVGGFLGLGGYLVAVPYNALNISADGSKIVLTQGGTKQELQNMQKFQYQQATNQPANQQPANQQPANQKPNAQQPAPQQPAPAK